MTERRLQQKEESLERKAEGLEKRENNLQKREEDVRRTHEQLSELIKQQTAELERISGLSSEEARKLLLSQIEEEIKHEAAILVREIEAQAKEEGEKRA